MKQIYLYDGYFEKGDAGWDMVRWAAAQYGAELGLPYDFASAEIQRTDKGKPFFVDIPVEFSLSHSGVMWMCLFGDKPCGLDLQVVEPKRDYEPIVRRRYTAEEQHYVELWGREGFYEIWVRKEAFGKCTGMGIFSDMPSMVDDKTDLKKVLAWEDLLYTMEALEISPEMKCAVCTVKNMDEQNSPAASGECRNDDEGRIELRILG